MDFENISRLPEFGFDGGIPISELQKSCRNVPEEPGVYLVVRNDEQSVSFRTTNPGGHFRGRNPSVLIEALEEKWLDRPKVVYIGAAGGITKRTTLRCRLRLYMRFGLGKACAHWGGRYIWQLENAGELLIFWKLTICQEPQHVETELLREFRQTYGRLPFANLKM